MNSKDEKNDSENKMINLKTMLGKTAGIFKKSFYTADESNIEKKIKDAVKKILPSYGLVKNSDFNIEHHRN